MFVYLDNSATTRQYDEVTDIMADAMRNYFGNPSSLHSLGLASEKKVKTARAIIAETLGVTSDEVFFTSGGTEGDSTAIYGVCNARKREGRKIITSKVEHPAVLEACKVMEKNGFQVEYIDVDRYCHLNMEQLKNAIDDETILISIMAVNNEVGTIMPLKEIAELKGNATFHTDAVQGYGKVNMAGTGADLISMSAHKIHGPKGIGALYIKKSTKTDPFMVGGGQEKHMRAGTENVPGILGFARAAELMNDSFAERTENMAKAKAYLKEGLSTELKDLLINTPEDSAPSVLNISFMGTRAEVLLHTLEQDEIFVSTGSACSSNKKGNSHVLKAMGLKDKEIEGAIRFSFSEFNTIEEMDYVLDKVKNAVNRFRRLGSFR